MDVVKSCTVWLLVFIQISVILAISTDSGDSRKDDCRQCKPGYHAERNCTGLYDTICAPCPVQHFTDHYNIYQQCIACSVCGDGFFVLSPCTPTADVHCESCDNHRASSSSSYRHACLGKTEKNVVSMGESSMDEIQEDKTKKNVTTNDTSSVEFGSGEIPVSSEISFGEDIPLSPAEKEVGYAILTENSTGLELGNDTDDDGSGHIDIVIYDFPTHLTDEPPSVAPDLEEDELIPVSSRPLFGSRGGANVTTTELPKTTNGSTTETPSTVVTDRTTRSSTVTTEAEVNYHAIRAMEDNRSNEESDNVTVGVVVAVAVVAAIVFFILGFLVSRYCRRRRRSFQIMKKVGKNNKHKDDEGKDGDPSRIYDEIGKGPNGKYTPKSSEPDDALYAVPMKKSFAPRTNQIPPSNVDNFSSLEGIKYIDETTDDETDSSPREQLLRPKDKETTAKMNGSTPRNSVNLSSIGEEKQPMLPNNESVAV